MRRAKAAVWLSRGWCAGSISGTMSWGTCSVREVASFISSECWSGLSQGFQAEFLWFGGRLQRVRYESYGVSYGGVQVREGWICDA